jgi:hypothetical protein
MLGPDVAALRSRGKSAPHINRFHIIHNEITSTDKQGIEAADSNATRTSLSFSDVRPGVVSHEIPPCAIVIGEFTPGKDAIVP